MAPELRSGSWVAANRTHTGASDPSGLGQGADPRSRSMNWGAFTQHFSQPWSLAAKHSGKGLAARKRLSSICGPCQALPPLLHRELAGTPAAGADGRETAQPSPAGRSSAELPRPGCQLPGRNRCAEQGSVRESTAASQQASTD